MARELTDASAVTTAMSEIWKLRPAKEQFTTWNDTLRFFSPRQIPMESDGFHWKAYIQPMRGVRRTKSGAESEFPAPRQYDYQDIEADWDDLSEFQLSLQYTGLAAARTKTRRAAVRKVAEQLVSEADDDFAQQVNVALHQTADCTMALIATKTNEDGTTYSSGQTDAFLGIDGGPISRFVKGQILDIRAASDNANIRVAVVVNDVYFGSDGPGDGVGPGIVVTIDSTRNTDITGDSDLDNLVDNDEIALSAETADNFDGFPSWFSNSTNVLNITRSTKGQYWTVPHLLSFGDVTFDMEEHLRTLAELVSRAVRAGRRSRTKGAGKGLTVDGVRMTGAMLALGTPAISSEANSQAGDSARFTAALSMTLEAEERRELFGELGFDGIVFHHESLPPTAIRSDPVATEDTLRLLEPNSWFLLAGHEGGMRNAEMLNKDGSFWHYNKGANGRLVNQLVGGMLMRLEFVCDQPQANAQISGIKSSVTP